MEPFRIGLLTPKCGDIGVNEHRQKFKLLISSEKLITLEPYEGKSKAVFFVFMGKLPGDE
jgi:hypothetical protein